MIAYSRSGAGPPLLLIHAAGMSRRAWDPVRPELERARDVIAVDLPGHGKSGPMPDHLAAAPPGFALELARLLDELGIERAHVAGNSVGGWTALEVGKLGRAQSVVALGPPGLWRHGSPRATLQLVAMHLGARAGRPAALAAVRTRLGRRLLLGTTVGDPDGLPTAAAAQSIEDLAGAAGFIPTVVDTHFRRFAGGQGIDVPVTVVFGERERIVPRSARRREELPAHTRWLEPPRLGHVPMWDDPALVAEIVLGEGSAA